MAITVEIEGKGIAEFPDGTDPAVIERTVKQQMQGQQPQQPAQPPADTSGRVDGVPKWGQQNPNVYAATMTALDFAPALASFAKSSGVGIPVAGAVNAAARAGQRAIGGEEQTGGAVLEDFLKGMAVEGGGRAIGKTIGTASKVVSGSPIGSKVADWLAKKGYQSAMKFSTSPTVLPPSERAAITETGLKYGFMPKDADYLRLKGMVGKNTESVDRIIAEGTAAGDTVPAERLLELGDFQKLYGRGESLRGVTPQYKGNVRSVENRLIRGEMPLEEGGMPRPYTPQDINTSKRQLYNELEDAYAKNTLSKPTVQAKKQLAYAHKLALEELYPEIKKINANSKELLDLSDHLARSIGRVQNRDIIGLGDKIVMDTIGSIPKAESSVGKTLWGSVVAALDHPRIKAELARVLYKANTGKTLPMSQWQKGVKYIGQAASSAPVRGAFDAAVLSSDPLGLRGQ